MARNTLTLNLLALSRAMRLELARRPLTMRQRAMGERVIRSIHDEVAAPTIDLPRRDFHVVTTDNYRAG